MDVIEALMGRRTIHEYVPEPVSKELVERALLAATRAPNHKLTNPWRFIWVGPTVRQRLCEVGVAEKRKKKPELSAAAIQKVRDKWLNPAELIVVTQERHPDPFRQREDYAAVACAIQNLSLALWSSGIGSKWSTGSATRSEDAYQILGVDPQVSDIVGFCWIGVPASVPQTARLPLSDVLRMTD